MFYQMQDIAWEHANLLGFGYDTLKKEQQFWVLSRLLVKIGRRPVWAENFTLETWSRGTDGFYGYRDFNFVDETGENIIQATSSWLVQIGRASWRERVEISVVGVSLKKKGDKERIGMEGATIREKNNVNT